MCDACTAESHTVRTSVLLHRHVMGFATEMHRSMELLSLYLLYFLEREHAVDSTRTPCPRQEWALDPVS